MEVQLAAKGARSNGGRSTPPHHHHHTGNKAAAAAIPNYLKPSTGSCHHVCKYGGAHTFPEERDAPRKQPPVSDQQQKKAPIRARLVPRKLFGDRSKRGEKDDKEGKVESVEWKDIVAYDEVPAAYQGSVPIVKLDGEQSAQMVMGSGDVKNKDVMKGKKSRHKAGNAQQIMDGFNSQNGSMDRKLANKSAGSKMTSSNKVFTEPPTHHRNVPRVKKPAALAVAKKKSVVDPELVDGHGYQPLSPSLLQKRASLLRELEEEMVHEDATTTNPNGPNPASSPLNEQQEFAAEASRPIPAHRRAKSMGISSRSVRFPFTRQASKNSSATFKLRSRSSKGPVLPSEEEKPAPPPARLRSTRGSVGGGGDDVGRTGRGIQLRIKSLRRRGVGGSGGGSAGFVVPAVALRHQKTLEKKRSQRLYNNVIEETASRLVKTRKSRVRALVGAFESVISKIAK